MRNKKDGFTLVELVVVIAIIGVLAAVVTPKVSLALTKSKDTKALANLNTIRTAAKMLHAETGETLYFLTGGDKVPVEGSNELVTNEHIKKLIDKKYLDDTVSKLIEGLAETDSFKLEVGANMEKKNCTDGNLNSNASMTNEAIEIVFEADGVGLKFKEEKNANGDPNVDASCNVWSEK